MLLGTFRKDQETLKGHPAVPSYLRAGGRALRAVRWLPYEPPGLSSSRTSRDPPAGLEGWLAIASPDPSSSQAGPDVALDVRPLGTR